VINRRSGTQRHGETATIFSRRQAHHTLKHFAERAGVFVSDRPSDLLDRVVGEFEHLSCLADAQAAKVPAPVVIVLQELFGVNADIRATCDELAAQGFVAIAPDLFWRQEPGVDLNVRSEADWQHGLRLYTAYDRDAGAKDIMQTIRTAVALPESSGKVALQATASVP
jgi:dienelactone hydrolase family protein